VYIYGTGTGQPYACVLLCVWHTNMDVAYSTDTVHHALTLPTTPSTQVPPSLNFGFVPCKELQHLPLPVHNTGDVQVCVCVYVC
jgi:hypothetical protein